jgi:hypothetical protein
MKQITKLKINLMALCVITALCLNAQQAGVKNDPVLSHGNGKLIQVPDNETLPANQAAGKTTLVNCTDKINYVGNTSQYYIQVGGNYAPSFYKLTGAFQVYPSYKGTITSVEFNAAKFNSNVNVYVAIFGVDSWGQPITTTQSAPASVMVNNTVNSLYTAVFSTPFVTTSNNGFAVGLYTLGNTDSVKVFSGPQITSWSNNYGYISTAPNNYIYDFPTFLGSSYDLNVLLRPIVTTSISASMTSAKTSTGCALPFVFSFTNTTSPSANPSYLNDQIINPGGITRSLDFGDGSTPVSNFNASVSNNYTATGTYIANYSRTYVGWTNDCVESSTTQITVDVPVPAFTFNASGLTVSFVNTSQNLSNFLWNFGDLSTSMVTDPTHTFPSPGTYIVELEGTAPCGKVRHSVSITVSGVGIQKNSDPEGVISLFPNPVSNTLKINNSGQKEFEGTVEIFNSIGVLVKTIENKNLVAGTVGVDVSDLAKGMYILKLKSKDGDLVKSFVKD